jgi:hypothetical protein
MGMRARSTAILVSVAALAGPGAAPAGAGAEQPFRFGFGRSPVLKATLHPTLVSKEHEYDFDAKVSLRVAGKTVARLAPFSDRATTTPRHLAIKVPYAARQKVASAARKRHTRRVTLAISVKGTRAGEVLELVSFTQNVALRVPRR